MDAFDILQAVFGICALGYIISIPRLPYTGDFMIKSIPAVTLCIMALVYLPGITGQTLALGFFFSAVGDTALSFEKSEGGEGWFIGGLGAFLIAHVCYMVAFFQHHVYQPGRLPVAIALILFAVVMAAVLWPRLGKLRLPVLVYIAVIMGMGIAASFNAAAGVWLIVGAVLFMLSDSLIAVNKFLREVPMAHLLIMITYYSGQWLILMSYFFEIPQGATQ